MIQIAVPEIAWADRRERILEFPDGWDVRLYPMRGFEAEKIGREELLKALRNPIGSKPLRMLAEGREEVAIVFDDHTRPTKVEPIARAVLEELKASGIRDDHIRFIAATGAHGAMNRMDFVKSWERKSLSATRYTTTTHFTNARGSGRRVGVLR